MELGKLVEDIYVDLYDDNKYIKVYENMVVAKGGDGTLLKAINMYRHLKKPFYGINAGTLGFLMNEKLPRYYNNPKIKSFRLIKVKIKTTKNIQEFQAFNDVCIGGDMNAFIEFKVEEKDDFFGKIQGGGLIISTPQGSTGVNKSNTQVISPLSANQWIISGDKTLSPLLMLIKPRKMNISVSARTSVTCWIDGSNHIINDIKSIELSKGDEVKVIFGDYDNFKKKRRI